ncbi:MAG: hypothetical protein MUC88_14970 [Planctomycetes bacterium]|jgi:uncharacterized protein involved in exopolysaccharide biosynthesis|nr:hypothetical protein [Planctomycetota bacterium]
MTLVEYVEMIRKYRMLILLLCGIAAGTAAIGGMLSPPMYSATTVFVPREQVELARGLGSADGFCLRRVSSVADLMILYKGTLGRRAVLDGVIEKLGLDAAYEESSRAPLRRKLRSCTTIDTARDGTMSVTVKDQDPRRAAAIANAYVEELNRQNRFLHAEQAKGKRLFIENRLEEIQQELGRMERPSPREVAAKEMVLELLTREHEIVQIEEARNAPTVHVLDMAIPPDDSLPRNIVKQVVLAGGLSLIAAFFLIHVVEHARALRSRRIVSSRPV